MCITGCLTDFSLPEILQLLARGKRTGLLKLHILPESETAQLSNFYIWVEKGRIVAAANRLDRRGLISLMVNSHWVSDRVLLKLIEHCYGRDRALGTFLKQQGVLSPAQLEQLFIFQVLLPIHTLSQLTEGLFQFAPNILAPKPEKTGLSILANQVIPMAKQPRSQPTSQNEEFLNWHESYAGAADTIIDREYELCTRPASWS
jgi:hypothetical protein